MVTPRQSEREQEQQEVSSESKGAPQKITMLACDVMRSVPMDLEQDVANAVERAFPELDFDSLGKKACMVNPLRKDLAKASAGDFTSSVAVRVFHQHLQVPKKKQKKDDKKNTSASCGSGCAAVVSEPMAGSAEGAAGGSLVEAGGLAYTTSDGCSGRFERGVATEVDVARVLAGHLKHAGLEVVHLERSFGHLNLRLSDSKLSDCLCAFAAAFGDGAGPLVAQRLQREVVPAPGPGVRVMVDFSQPNIAKEMHVGHLRSTIIGNCFCNLFEYCGYTVERLNHIGDWGTQFGMLIEYLREDPALLEASIADLMTFYKASKRKFDDDPDFKRRARETVPKLQRGETFEKDAWEKICAVSRKAFQLIYDRLGVVLEERGESWYNDMIPRVIQELTDLKLIVESDGAKVIYPSQELREKLVEIPLMIVKSDGGYGYDTTDMAALHHRLMQVGADWLVYVTDDGQSQHFQQVFDAAKQAGWWTTQRVEHIGFGVVQGEDGKRMKTRAGETIRLARLLDEARDRAQEELVKRTTSAHEGMALPEMAECEKRASAYENMALPEMAECLGIAAVMYFDLHQDLKNPYQFDFDQILQPKGNTAVYVIYGYARLCGILRKVHAGKTLQDEQSDPSGKGSNPPASAAGLEAVTFTHGTERKLALKLLEFPDVVADVLQKMRPHKMADFAYDLVSCFTDFYGACPVANCPKLEVQASRLELLRVTQSVLKKACQLLGFMPLEAI